MKKLIIFAIAVFVCISIYNSKGNEFIIKRTLYFKSKDGFLSTDGSCLPNTAITNFCYKGISFTKKSFYSNNDTLSGYWGIKNDTLYFAPFFIEEEKCMLLFPMFYLKMNDKDEFVTSCIFSDEMLSGEVCDTIPVFPTEYIVNLVRTRYDDGDTIYYFKHQVYNEIAVDINEIALIDTLNDSKFDTRYFTLSQKRGILSIERKKSSKGFFLPYSFSYYRRIND